ncbi:MAG: adenosylcobinamide-GDP ribazoletransferase [Christensenella sp.]|nr:adenosylcobinamide-GDP ribazoletransferase [Christensenella sp.]
MKHSAKDLLRSVAMAFSTFSRVPMPKVEWKPENQRYLLASFPLVGVLIGLVLAAWWALCQWLVFDGIFFAAGVTLLPVLVSGGIHLDGFCDTVDALSSHATPERKREILKDPHVGAFAVIGISAYLLAHFALATELVDDSGALYILFLIPAMSRAVAGYVSVASKSSGEGMLSAMRDSAPEESANQALIVWFVVLTVIMLSISPFAGLFVALSAALSGWLVSKMATRQFGGMSGDLSGYLVQVGELAMLAALMLTQRVMWIWFW